MGETEHAQEAHELREDKRWPWKRIAKFLSDKYGKQLKADALRGRAYEYKKSLPDVGQDDPHVAIDGDTATVSTKGTRIMSVDDLLLAADLDLDEWEVVKQDIATSEVARKDRSTHVDYEDGKATGRIRDSGRMHVETLYHVKVTLRRREIYPFEEMAEALVRRVHKAAPSFKVLRIKKDNEGVLFVPSIYDAHFGKLSVDGRYAPEQAADAYKLAMEGLISGAVASGRTIARTLLVVGQDALNSDNWQGTTTKGTPQDNVGHPADAIDALQEATVHSIHALLNVGPVDVRIIPGNHDRYSMLLFARLLAAWFRKHPNVDVSTDPALRQYYRFGSVLLGLTHGDEEKHQDLPMIMAAESPDYSTATHREWLTGHFHKSRNMYYRATEDFGVNVRVMPALCPPDQWHVMRGYVGNRQAAMGLLYHPVYGPAGEFPVFVDELETAPAVKAA